MSKSFVCDPIQEYPNQYLMRMSGQLQCKAYKETLAFKKSIDQIYVEIQNRQQNRVTSIDNDKKESQTIVVYLQRQGKRRNVSDSTLPAGMRTFSF